MHQKSIFLKLLVISCALVASQAFEKASYQNYRVYKVFIANTQQLNLMQQIENYPDGVKRLFEIIEFFIIKFGFL